MPGGLRSGLGGGESWDRGSSYSKKLHVLFTRPEKPYPFYFEPTLHGYRLGELANKKKPQTIFVCSMADLFGDWVPDEWVQEVFKACETAPQHKYLFLTKNIHGYCDHEVPLKDNYWYGQSHDGKTTSLTCYDDLRDAGAHTFVSVEPLSGSVLPAVEWFDWVIIGAETGKRKGKVVPKREWIEDIVVICKEHGTPVFMKDSLAGVWGGPLVREFP